MNRLKTALTTLFLFLIMTSSMESFAKAPNCFKLKKPFTDKSGVFRFQLTPAFHDSQYAYSFLGEVGDKNYRANITYAWEGGIRVRYKLTGEYLSQYHQYRFSNSSKKQWVHQVAIGGATQLVCCLGFLHTIEIAGDYSHAYRRKLDEAECEAALLKRRICGSQAYHIQAGSSVSTPYGGMLKGWVGYDSVEYNRVYRQDSKIKGIGGGALLEQPIQNALAVALLADIKKPYHFYECQLNWKGNVCGGYWAMGAFTNYTSGKNGLPNDYKIGAQFAYRFGSRSDCQEETCQQFCDLCSLEHWASTPAVYRPITLNIPDQSIPDCETPEVIGNPPTGLGITVNSTIPPFDFSEFFSGSPLRYTATNLPPNLTFDINTGIMSGTTVQAGVFESTITARNACGQASIIVQITVTGED